MDAADLARELLGHLAVLVLSSYVVMGSPGPSTLSAMSVAAAFGWHGAAMYLLGLIVGTTGVLVILALGLFTFITALPWLNAIVTAIATSYVLFLAYKIATAPRIEEVAQVRQPSFSAAAALAMANPKAYLAVASVFGGTIVLADHRLDVILKLVALTIMVVAIHVAWMFGGASLGRKLRDARSARLANLTMGVLLAGSVLLPLLH
jgi:threonine/homoserine/homoserine lactone efflux protein